MLGNSIFGSLLSQVPPVPMSSASVSQPQSNNGLVTVSLLPQQTAQLQHAQQQHQQQQQQQQHQPQLAPQQQHQQPQQQAQFIQAHQLTPQQQHQLLQNQTSLQNLVLTQMPGLNGAPTMIITNNHPSLFTTANATNATQHINAVANVTNLANTQQIQTSVNNNTVATSSSKSIDLTIQQVMEQVANLSGPAVALVNNVSASPQQVAAPRPAPTFRCDICNKVYKYRHGLTQHVQQTHMNRDPFPCSDCGKTFTRKYQLHRHMRIHNSAHDTYHCADCGEVFHMRESYLLHIRTHTTPEENPYRCDICSTICNNKTLLIKHRRKEHPGAPTPPRNTVSYPRVYQTTVPFNMNNPTATVVTDNANSNSMMMGTSAMIVTNNTNFNSVFKRRQRKKEAEVMNVMDPNAVPLRLGKHQCSTCGKRFTNMYGLKRHERTHTGERPHDCDICGLTFMERSHMKQHRLTHTGETPYHCDICNRGFNRKFSYQRHLRWHNKGLFPTLTQSVLRGGSGPGACSTNGVMQGGNVAVSTTRAARRTKKRNPAMRRMNQAPNNNVVATSNGDGSGSAMTDFLNNVVNEIAANGIVNNNNILTEIKAEDNKMITVAPNFNQLQQQVQQQQTQQNQQQLIQQGNNNFMMTLNGSMNATAMSHLQPQTHPVLFTTTSAPQHPGGHSVAGASFANNNLVATSFPTMNLGNFLHSAPSAGSNGVSVSSSQPTQMVSLTIPTNAMSAPFNFVSSHGMPMFATVALPTGHTTATIMPNNAPNTNAR